ncbi:formyltetrahydrofolate-dependent phosphoribosylglycinamide formyltransferase [Granulicella pectinivorans]|jgi:phosphoribosylglycinamide formyltransferase-1|uniref:Phosphoribosylglycinamide formyltransferase n=1 Tax=Granulicella pectinivorans TaxID=474950 RepID=A0A1I6LMG2_9BACT|nr:phosphoribosylglycinamide formyltransferase [Granulicella pectinivorans]SFS04635.1 formyltetrahydrofolate-dependent phosphoribosylglycinamide formyltransferase [Granulicella pectinivorans]
MTRLGVLLSGRGSNFSAIAQAIKEGTLRDCEIAVVIANREDAVGLEIAREMGLPARCIVSKGVPRAEHDAAVIAALKSFGVELVVLAGYMRVLTPAFIAAFPQAILNIHPSLLPSFAGLDVQKAALEYGVKFAGCTVHFVDEAVDHGVIVLQRTVEVLDADTPATLAARILVEEHQAYPEAIARVISGQYTVVGRRYIRA